MLTVDITAPLAINPTLACRWLKLAKPHGAIRSLCEHMFVPRISPKESRDLVRSLLGLGLSDREVAERSGVGRATVQRWRRRGIPRPREPLPDDWRPPDSSLYSYLLGIFLGDGTLTRHHRTWGLHIFLDVKHPDILEEVTEAVKSVFGKTPHHYPKDGGSCVQVTSYSQDWAQMIPQHGPGKKHERKIELVGWQQDIVAAYPWEFLRGLIHSDGSRCLNTFTVNLKHGPREYTYPRYFFTNYSEDIRKIFCATCDQLGIRWSQSNWRNISISHRKSVARLDQFIGPKS